MVSLTKERGLSLTNSSAAAIPIINWHTFIGATDWGSWQVLLIFLFVYPLYNKISFKQCWIQSQKSHHNNIVSLDLYIKRKNKNRILNIRGMRMKLKRGETNTQNYVTQLIVLNFFCDDRLFAHDVTFGIWRTNIYLYKFSNNLNRDKIIEILTIRNRYWCCFLSPIGL